MIRNCTEYARSYDANRRIKINSRDSDCQSSINSNILSLSKKIRFFAMTLSIHVVRCIHSIEQLSSHGTLTV